MSDEHPRGILRNRPEGYHEESDFPDKLDRNEVIKNTQLNAQLASGDRTAGDEIRAKIAAKKKEEHHDEPNIPEHLKWDEINLYKNEQEKSATMKIDEPKTPYEGGFNPEGEYYKDDNEEEEEEDIPAFELGEGEFDKLPHDVLGSLNGGLVVKDENQVDENVEDQEEEEENKEAEPELSFEEKRKRHYHLKALPLKSHETYVD